MKWIFLIFIQKINNAGVYGKFMAKTMMDFEQDFILLRANLAKYLKTGADLRSQVILSFFIKLKRIFC